MIHPKLSLCLLCLLVSLIGNTQPNNQTERLTGVHLCTWQDVDGNGITSADEFLNLGKVIYNKDNKLRLVFYSAKGKIKNRQKYCVKLISVDEGYEKYLDYKREPSKEFYTTVDFEPFPGKNKVEYWVENEDTYYCEFTAESTDSIPRIGD